MDIGAIIGLVSAGLALLSAAVGLGFKLYTVCKELVKDKNWAKIMKIALTAMETAEKTGASGADKKAQVIEAVKAACDEMGVNAAPFMDDLSKYIDEIIDVTKKVNVKAAAKKAKVN